MARIVPGRISYVRASASYAEAKMAADGYQTNCADASAGQNDHEMNTEENVKKMSCLFEMLVQEIEVDI